MAIDSGSFYSTKTASLYARARTHIPQNYITLPTQWLSQYTTFVRANASQVSQLESALRSLVYIIPGRFHETPLQTESLQTILALLQTYHTYILSPTPSDPDYHPSPQTRYQNFCRATSPLYARCATLLRTVQYTQLLCEMFAKRAGEKVRWRVVLVLEVVKAVCRVCMGFGSDGRVVVGTGMSDGIEERRIGGNEGVDDGEGQEWRMPRTGMRLPRLPEVGSGESVVDFLGRRVISADEIKNAKRLVRTVQSVQGRVAELMWILRPLLYVAVLQRCRENKRDWRPWVLGLAMEVAARGLAKKDVREGVVGGIRGLSMVESEEMSRRGWGIVWWGMRGAFYENVTRGWIQRLAEKLKGRPVLDMVGILVEDYDFLWDQYYFPTATT